MADIQGVTEVADVGDAVLTEKMDKLALVARQGHIYPWITMMIPPEKTRGAPSYKFPWLDASANAVAIPDGTDIDAVVYTGDAASATQGEVAQRVEVSNPTLLAQLEAEEASVLNAMGSVHAKIDTDVLALFTSATNASDFSGTTLTKAKILAALRDFKKQIPGEGMYALVLHPDQIADIQAEVVTAAGTANLDAALGYAGMFGPDTGYKGTLQGYHLFETTRVPQFDATNWSGAVLRIPRAEMDYGALGLAVWDPLRVQFRPNPRATSHNMIAHAMVGMTITQQTMLREIISAKA